VSNLLLQWNHRPTPKSSSKASRTKYSAPTLIRLVKDTRAFDVRLRRPRTGKQVDRTWLNFLNSYWVVELGPSTSSKLLLAVSSGRNYILKATLKLSGPPGVTFHVQDSALDGDGESQKFSKPHGSMLPIRNCGIS